QIHMIGELFAGLHRGDVRIDENDPEMRFAKRFQGLRARIVEFPGLSNLERTGAEKKHRHFLPFVHAALALRRLPATLRNRSKRNWVSRGPGWPSGWN